MEKDKVLGVSHKEFQYASFGRRLLAFLVDGFIVAILGFTVQSMLGGNPFYMIDATSFEELEKLQAQNANQLILLLQGIIGFAYYVLFYVNYEGATPGKRLMGIKVVMENNSKLGYSAAIVREIGTIISAVPFGIGYLMVLWDKKKQALHDKIAKTVVVKTESKPKTLLAIFIGLVGISFAIFYTSIFVYKGYQLGLQEIKEQKNLYSSTKSYDTLKSEMNADAKVHYDRSMQLFEEMKKATDSARVKELNDENINELRMAIEIDPQNPLIWYQLGNAYTWISSEGTLDDGLTAYRKAEELDPSNPIYINGVGDMLISMERYDEAVLEFKKTLRLTDTSGYANQSIADAYVMLGINDLAKEHYQKAIEIFSSENTDGSYDSLILEMQKQLSAISK